ncbi:hypothetical protein ACFL6C_01120 [Myxococcota bacterium]
MVKPRATAIDRSTLVENLVCAMLAVNNWPLEQAYALRENLEKEGLTDLARLRRMQHQEVFAALRRAGYTKADFVTGLLVERLQDMAEKLRGKLDEVDGLLKTDPDRAETFLASIKGVGPVVIRNFLMLHGRQ